MFIHSGTLIDKYNELKPLLDMFRIELEERINNRIEAVIN
jgi:hypothetical protein